MSVELIMSQGSSAGTAAPIHQGYYLVGRHKECQIRPKSRSVSRRHCLLLHNDDGFGALDLKSTGGTYVNGKRIEPHQWFVLHDGDEIRFGKVAFDVRIKEPAVAAKSQAKPEPVGAASHRSSESSAPPKSWHNLDVAEFLEAEEQLEFELQNGFADAVQPPDADVLSDPDGGRGKPGETFIGDAVDLEEDDVDEMAEAAVEVDSKPKQRPPRRKIDPKEYKRAPKRSFSLPSISLSGGDGVDWKLLGSIVLVALTVGLFAYQIYRFQAGPSIEVRENLD